LAKTSTPSTPPDVDSIVLCALDLEYQAMRRRLTGVKEAEHPSGTLYEVGSLVGCDRNIALVVTGVGDPVSAAAAERAIQYFQPGRACFVGIAGGLKDVSLGDVVVADRVIAYERGKVTDQGQLPRIDSKPSTGYLVDRARAVARGGRWRQRLPRPVRSVIEPRVRLGTIAAGAKVVASERSDTYRYLQAYCSDALAIEIRKAHGATQASKPSLYTESPTSSPRIRTTMVSGSRSLPSPPSLSRGLTCLRGS
jgi:nucleoside phosphorylase